MSDAGSHKAEIAALSEREKETLRLLLAGHDAKSIARELVLSVHTVNERLREARRKLGVSSSREAARRLAAAEGKDHEFLGNKNLGVAAGAGWPASSGQPNSRKSASHPLAWLGGGMLVMSLIIAAVVLSSLIQGDPAPARTPSPRPAAAEDTGVFAAQAWLALIDRHQWDESWRTAGAVLKQQLSAQQWTVTVQPVRQPLGAVARRALMAATPTKELPGAPAGDYEVVQFQSRFAQKPQAVETVILMREGANWKVVGYFIR